MTPAKISGANVNFGAPENWNEKLHGACATLPVRVADLEGSKVCQSDWCPSRDELDAMISGHAVILTVWGHQPVVSLSVEKVEQ